MTRLTHCVLLLAVGLALAFASTATANMLKNGDFEDTTSPSTGLAAPFWPRFQYTSTSSLDTTQPNNGAMCIVQEGGFAGDGGGSTGIYQLVTGITEGTSYDK